MRYGKTGWIAMGCAALLAGCGSHPQDPPAEAASAAPVTVETARVTLRPIETTVTAQGTLSPGQGASAKVAAVSPAKVTAVLVREGDRVRAGQVVATLDARSATAQARSAQAALSAAMAEATGAQYSARSAATDQANALRQTKLALSAAQIDRDNAVQQAQTALQSAQTDLAKIRAGARPEEIAQADQAVKQAQATRDRAATEADRVRFLFQKGVDSKRDLDDAETALSVSESGLASAQAQAKLVRAGARPEDVQAAQLRVKAAQEALQQAHTSGDAHVREVEAALQQARQGTLQVAAKRQEAVSMQQAAAQKQADFAAAETAAGYAVLRSPLTGIVTRRAADPGDMADPATPILEIADTRSLDLIADIPAEDGLKVRPGMPARVSASGLQAPGRVLSVGQVDPQTNLLSVRIRVSNPDGRLRSGAFAVAQIVVRTDRRAITVPKEAVLSREGGNVVFTVSSDGTAHQKTVALGPEQEGFVEVAKGLAPGETVVRLGQYELTDGAKVKPAGPRAQTS